MSTIESLELQIVSNSKSATDGIEALTRSLENLRTAAKGGSGLSPLSEDLKKVKDALKTAGDISKKSSSSFTDFFHIINSGARAISNLGGKIMSAIKESSEYTENMNLFNVSMGEYADQATGYAEKVSNAMGIDTSEWVRAQGIFMTMSTGFGVASDRAYTMSKNLTQLGYDLSSFYNIDVETAMQKLKSGLAGELEPLRAIGYDLSQAKLEATALALGIDKSVSSMTQAEKAQLRYYAIMTQVTESHGDMARTLDDPANQMRVLKAEFNMATREIGNLFIPALNAILPVAIALTRVIRGLADTIAGLFGQEVSNISDVTSTVVTNTDATTQNLKDAQKEAKKLKSYMLGIDELNVINPSAESTEDSSGQFNFELPDYENLFMDELVESKISDIVEKMKEWLGLTQDIESWSDLLETNLGNILVSVGLIGVGLAAWKISTLLTDLPKLMGIINGISVALKAIGATVVILAAVAGAKWIIENTESTLTKIGAVISGAMLAVGAILAFTGINLPLGIALMAVGALTMGSAIAMNSNKLSDNAKDVVMVLTTLLGAALLPIGAILAFTGVSIPLGIALMAGGAVALATVVAPNWNKMSDEMKGVLEVILGTISAMSLVLGAVLAFTGVGIPLGIALIAMGAAGLATVVALNWNAISDALKGPVGIITALVTGALLVLGVVLCFTGVGIPLGIALIAAGAAGLATVVALNWNTIKDGIKKIIDGVLKILSGAMLVLGVLLCLSGAGIGLGLSLIFGALKLSNKAWGTDDNPITRFVKKMVNGIVKIINLAIDGINWIGDIKFPGLSIGGVEIIPSFNHKLWNIPHIPLMAGGGFLDQGQMFIAREAGAEMVGNIGRRTAVVNNDQIVASISGGVAEANEEQNALLREQNSLLRALLEKDSGVYLDGKNLTNSVEKYQRERGRVLITGGVI